MFSLCAMEVSIHVTDPLHSLKHLLLYDWMGTQSVDELSKKIKGRVAEVYVIGDAQEPRKALEAIAEGAEIGRKI